MHVILLYYSCKKSIQKVVSVEIICQSRSSASLSKVNLTYFKIYKFFLLVFVKYSGVVL